MHQIAATVVLLCLVVQGIAQNTLLSGGPPAGKQVNFIALSEVIKLTIYFSDDNYYTSDTLHDIYVSNIV